MKLITTVFLLCILLSTSSLALGISPARSIIEFSPGLIQEKTLTIYNNEHKDLDLQITLEGPLRSYVNIPSDFHVSEKEETKKLSYTLKLPSFINAGEHIAKIRITEPQKVSNNTINSQLSITHKITVKVSGTEKRFYTTYATFINLTKVPKIIPTTFIPQKIKQSENNQKTIELINLTALATIVLLLGIIVVFMLKQPKNIKQAKAYISQALAKGYTEQDIKKAAINAGWPSKIVKKLFKK